MEKSQPEIIDRAGGSVAWENHWMKNKMIESDFGGVIDDIASHYAEKLWIAQAPDIFSYSHYYIYS